MPVAQWVTESRFLRGVYIDKEISKMRKFWVVGMYLWLTLFLVLVVVAEVFGQAVCRQMPVAAEAILATSLAITNGTDIPETKYPEIRQLHIPLRDGVNTGTASAISSTTLLTAGHLFLGSVGLPYVILNGKKYVAKKVIAAPVEEAGDLDLAVVVFDENIFSATVEMKLDWASVGQDVTLVGYGAATSMAKLNRLEKQWGLFGRWAAERTIDKECRKREGKTKIWDRMEHEYVFKGDENSVLMTQGDSGGPLLVDGRVAGVASKVYDVTRMKKGMYAEYMSLADPRSQEFLKTAVVRGADIPGVKARRDLREKAIACLTSDEKETYFSAASEWKEADFRLIGETDVAILMTRPEKLKGDREKAGYMETQVFMINADDCRIRRGHNKFERKDHFYHESWFVGFTDPPTDGKSGACYKVSSPPSGWLAKYREISVLCHQLK